MSKVKMKSILPAIFALLFVVSLSAQTKTAQTVNPQTTPDFSGHWRQTTKSGTQRDLEIEQRNRNLRVKTVVTNSEGNKSLEVKYEIGGAETSYTGLDGDQFRSSLRWEGNALVFDTTEHEAGSDIPQKIVWTLSADGNTLQVERTMTKAGQPSHSVTTFSRQP
jgi:hypothetical protein